MGLLAIRRGRAPNCSSGGSVIGLALISAVAASSVLTIWSHRLLSWRKGKARGESFGGILQTENPPGRLFVDSQTAEFLGIDSGASGPENALSAPTEVHVSLTHRKFAMLNYLR